VVTQYQTTTGTRVVAPGSHHHRAAPSCEGNDADESETSSERSRSGPRPTSTGQPSLDLWRLRPPGRLGIFWIFWCPGRLKSPAREQVSTIRLLPYCLVRWQEAGTSSSEHTRVGRCFVRRHRARVAAVIESPSEEPTGGRQVPLLGYQYVDDPRGFSLRLLRRAPDVTSAKVELTPPSRSSLDATVSIGVCRPRAGFPSRRPGGAQRPR
jgi:hypothetical protein